MTTTIPVSAAWLAITWPAHRASLFAISLAMMTGENDLVIVTL